MTREIIPYKPDVYNFPKENLPLENGLEEWVKKQATTPSWILAHALDGVFWGWANRDELHTSHEVAPKISPPLHLETLQQLRLFNLDYEVRLWRSTDNWKAIRITDVEDADAAAIEEQQLLWGTQAKLLSDDFMCMKDGSQGLMHVMPLNPPFENSEALKEALIQQWETNPDEYLYMGTRSEKELHRMCLKLRHYLTEDHLGVNSITLSRLTGLGVKPYGKSQ
jgi:CRISPR-associated protein (TIGR03984 family)